MLRSGYPSNFTQRADRKEVTKNPKMSSRDLQHALADADVKVHTSTIRKRHTTLTFMGGVQGGNLCSPRNMKARLKFARENVNKDQDFWNDVLWTVESTTELSGHQNWRLFDVNQIQHYRKITSRQLWRWRCQGLGMLCCSRTWSAHQDRIHHEFYRVSEGARRTCETICK